MPAIRVSRATPPATPPRSRRARCSTRRTRRSRAGAASISWVTQGAAAVRRPGRKRRVGRRRRGGRQRAARRAARPARAARCLPRGRGGRRRPPPRQPRAVAPRRHRAGPLHGADSTSCALPVPAELFVVLAHPDAASCAPRRRAPCCRRACRSRWRCIRRRRSAAMVAALARGDFALLGRAIDDRIAEPARAPLLPGFVEAKAAALAAGALGRSISGADPRRSRSPAAARSASGWRRRWRRRIATRAYERGPGRAGRPRRRASGPRERSRRREGA